MQVEEGRSKHALYKRASKHELVAQPTELVASEEISQISSVQGDSRNHNASDSEDLNNTKHQEENTKSPNGTSGTTVSFLRERTPLCGSEEAELNLSWFPFQYNLFPKQSCNQAAFQHMRKQFC
jgi:hypothetical protein